MIHLRAGRTFCAAVLFTLMVGCAPSRSARDGGAASPGRDGQPQAATSGALREGMRKAAHPLKGNAQDYDPLMRLVGDARFVLLGEATHGTLEFYRERARITERLIREKGFTAVAIEGDWPDAQRVHRFVRGTGGGDAHAEQALSGFTRRFPQWMWGNAYVRDLVASLREFNKALPAGAPRVGVYGLDLYSLRDSADAVAQSLERVDPEAARRARQRYGCFARFGADPQAYGSAAALNPASSCRREAQEQFEELQRLAAKRPARTDPAREEELFSALQNARVVKNGEEYYRTLYAGGMSSWNLRDRHMAESLDALASHLESQGRPPKVVVWAHNTHMGDARVTEMGEAGEWNVGQFMRQRHKDGAVLVGFTTYTGTVTAASAWGEPGRRMAVRPALPGSYSALFHDTGIGNFLLVLRGNQQLTKAFGEPRLERAIGVVYLPHTERASHYFRARLSKQFDAVIHIDESRALEPLTQ